MSGLVDRMSVRRALTAFYDALGADDLESLYEDAPCGFLTSTGDGRIVKVNRTFLAWTGYTEAGVLGRRLQDLLGPGDRIFHDTHYRPALLLQGQVRELALDLVTADGSVLPIMLSSVLARDERGEPSSIRTAVFDARERRAYEAELLAARRRAEESEARYRALAATLQSTFLPPALPIVPGLAIGGAYRPAGDGSEVGGDFYDVFETGTGRWGVVIGDVCGKGAQAASLTAVARYTIRAEAARAASPSEILGATHAALLRHDQARFCTALVVLLTRADDGWSATVASAGHDAPLVLRADGRVDVVPAAGSILGMVDEHRSADVHARLDPGDRLVLFTDGVTEGRADGALYGHERLVELLRAHAHLGGAELADAVAGAVIDYQDGATRDDIAVVTVEVRPDVS